MCLDNHMTKTTTTLKFVKVESWYGDLSRYEATVEHPYHGGRYIIDADPSDVYESRINGYTIKWVGNGSTEANGRQIGSRNLRFGRGERLLAQAKAAAQADWDA